MSLHCGGEIGGAEGVPRTTTHFPKRCQEGKWRLLADAQISEVVKGWSSGVNLLL